MTVTADLTGLKPNATYRVRLATNGKLTEPGITSLASGPIIMDGNETQFTTPDWRPIITVQPTTERTANSARINAQVNPQESPTHYHFEYGPTISYGTSVPIPEADIGSGAAAVAVSQGVAGLKPETNYHFRVVATNGEGTSVSPDKTLTTLANPVSFVSAFGSAGTGSGQFNRPVAMAVDAAGNVWVADKENDRLEKFNPKGEYLAQIGSFGAGNGQLNEPRGVAIDAAGNIWVADAGNARIEEFSAAGAYIRQIGPGESATDGTLQIPSGIAIGAEGNIFVTDQGLKQVRKYLPAPKTDGKYFVNSWNGFTTPANMATDPEGDIWIVDTGQNKIYELRKDSMRARFGTTGSGPGQLSAPYAVAVKPSGNLFVSDRGNNRIEQFSPEGELLATFGSAGSGAGQLNEPSGLAVSPNGSIFVADAANNRIERWAQPTKPEAATEPATNVAESTATLKGKVVPNGLATQYRFEYGTSASYGASLPVPEGNAGSGFERVEVAASLSGLSNETTYHYRVVATNAEGATYGQDNTLKTTAVPTYTFSFGSAGTGSGQFNRPVAMAVDAAGNVWVADKENDRLEKFNPKGEYLAQIGSPGASNGQLNEPRGVAIDAAGNIWVADAANHRIEEFSAAGAYIRQIGPGESATDGTLQIPSGIAIGREGHIFVTDQGLKQVREYLSTPKADGKYFVKRWTGFTTPANMATDSEVDIWIVDSGQNKVYELPHNSDVMSARFGTTGSGPGQLSAPYAVAVKPSGNLLISDRGNNRIEQFSPSGVFQQQFGAFGSGAGQFNEPSGIAIGLDGSDYIADAANNRVQKWIFK